MNYLQYLILPRSEFRRVLKDFRKNKILSAFYHSHSDCRIHLYFPTAELKQDIEAHLHKFFTEKQINFEVLHN